MGSVFSAILLAPVALLGCVAYVVLAVVGTACDIVSIVIGAIINLLCMPFLCCWLCFSDDNEVTSRRSPRTRSNLSSDITAITGKGGESSASSAPIRSSSINQTTSGHRLSGLSESTSNTDRTLHE